MAGLTQTPIATPSQPWTTAQTRGQFLALAQLRWCIFRNAFRRKGNIGELLARIVIFPILGVIAIGPILCAGIAGFYLISSSRFDLLPALTWIVFLLIQIVSINIAPPSLSFDLASIIRFPLSFPRYLTARLFFGLLSTSNVIGPLTLLSADIGIGLARPALLPWSTLLLATFALANIFFTRMVFAWIDRWLSTRRARELLTGFIVFASLGFQYLNVTFNPGLQGAHHHRPSNHLPFLLHLLHRVQPVATLLPPGLTAASITSFSLGHYATASASLAGLIAFTALFLAIYAGRMRREFHGENLSELTLTPHRIPTPTNAPTAAIPSPNRIARPISSNSPANLFSPILSACLQKEFLYLRRNTNQLYGFIAPIFMVFLFAGRLGASGRAGELVFPAAIAYATLGVSILSYNCLGTDGAGIQLYLLTPTRLRDIFLAKNLIGFLLILIELILILAVIGFVAHPPSLLIAVATCCWLLFTAFTNAAVGNLRSLTAPRKVDLSKVRRQTSQLSALIALAIIAACAAIGYAVFALANHLQSPWLMLPILFALAILGLLLYLAVLDRVDRIFLAHREDLIEELCKA